MLDRRAALRRMVHGTATGLAVGGWLLWPAPAAAGEPLTVEVLEKGSSSLFQLRAARRQVPVSRIAGAHRRNVEAVLKDVSIYRKLPEVRCQADPKTLEHFLANPDVAVGLWKSMGVSNMALTQVAPGVFDADDGSGSGGRVSVVYAQQGERVLYCAGHFMNPVARKPIEANCVVDFRYRYERGRGGAVFVRQSATMFVSLPSAAVEATARVISPVSNRIADKNFEEVCLFLRMMSEAMWNKPGWCESVGRGLVGVDERKIEDFLTCCAEVRAGELRRLAAAGGTTRR